ncbi:mucin-2-like [Homarus americanus]|uniref:mucin-2-like n=1 Tax=Homarus americanus TaxID=6706 RepID=UPI001C45C6B1|nr:mucin-2-like [Homarus americanus]
MLLLPSATTAAPCSAAAISHYPTSLQPPYYRHQPATTISHLPPSATAIIQPLLPIASTRCYPTTSPTTTISHCCHQPLNHLAPSPLLISHAAPIDLLLPQVTTATINLLPPSTLLPSATALYHPINTTATSRPHCCRHPLLPAQSTATIDHFFLRQPLLPTISFTAAANPLPRPLPHHRYCCHQPLHCPLTSAINHYCHHLQTTFTTNRPLLRHSTTFLLPSPSSATTTIPATPSTTTTISHYCSPSQPP